MGKVWVETQNRYGFNRFGCGSQKSYPWVTRVIPYGWETWQNDDGWDNDDRHNGRWHKVDTGQHPLCQVMSDNVTLSCDVILEDSD